MKHGLKFYIILLMMSALLTTLVIPVRSLLQDSFSYAADSEVVSAYGSSGQETSKQTDGNNNKDGLATNDADSHTDGDRLARENTSGEQPETNNNPEDAGASADDPDSGYDAGGNGDTDTDQGAEAEEPPFADQEPARAPAGEQKEPVLEGADPATDKLTWAITENEDGETYTLSFDGEGAVAAEFITKIISKEPAFKDYIDKITCIEFGDGITAIGNSAFRDKLTGLEEVTFSEDSQAKSIGTYAFYSSTNLTKVSLPAGLEKIESYAFYNNKKLAEINLPEGLDRIEGYAFASTKALTSITLPDSLTYLGDGAFNGSGLNGKVVVPGNVKTFGRDYYSPFSSCYDLKEIQFEENNSITKIGIVGLGYGMNALEVIDLSGLHSLTTLESAIISGTSSASGRLGIIIGARELTKVSNTAFPTGGKAGEKIYVTLTKDVEKVSENLFLAAGVKLVPSFAPDHDIEILAGSAASNIPSLHPFCNMAGKYHADENGVLYKLLDDGKAELFYVPPGITSYSVPEAITDGQGTEYTVSEIGSYAFRLAEDLKELAIEKPENIAIDANAFSKSNVKKVNGEDKIDPSGFAWVSRLCGFPLLEKDQIGPSEELKVDYETKGDKTFVLSIYNTDKSRLKDGIYEYLTGQSSTVWFGVNNEKNADMENITIRMYLAFDDDGPDLGTYPAGQQYTIVNTSSDPKDPDKQVTHEYPLNVVKTDVDGIYYYDLTGLQPGDVMAFSNGFMYPSIKTDGGNLKIISDVSQSEEKKNAVANN